MHPRARAAPSVPHRPRWPLGLAAILALVGLGLLGGAPTEHFIWGVFGLMLGAAATAGSMVGRHRVSAFADAAVGPADAHATDPGDPGDPGDSLLESLTTAADLSEDLIRILDRDGHIRWVNRTARVRAARASSGLLGAAAFTAKGGSGLDADTRARIKQHLSLTAPFTETIDVRTASGRARRCELSGQPITGPDGAVTGWVTVERDVTELSDRSHLLDMVLDASRAGMWDWHVPSGETRTTPNMHHMIGEPVPAGPVNLQWFTDRVHPDDAEALAQQLERSLADDEEPFQVSFRFGREDAWVWVRTAGRVIERDPHGRPLRMIGLHVNVDELNRSIDAAREATQLLHAIIDLVPVRICWKDVAGQHLGANEAYRRDHGHQSLLGRTDADLGLDPEELVRRQSRDRAARGPAASTADVTERWTRVDGSAGWRKYVCCPLHDSDGAVIGTITSYQDVTELKRVAEKLQEARDRAEAANQAKSEFLANMSHEIRTPMTAILGFADLLDEPDEDEAAGRKRNEAVTTIRRNGDQLLAILNDILDLSKIEAGMLSVEHVPVHPIRLIAEIQQLLAPRAQGKGITLDVAWDGLLPQEIRTDPVRLRQILANVVGNAIKFTETGGVHIRVSCPGAEDAANAAEAEDSGVKRLRIAVRDSGIGMNPEQATRIFDAFSQADTSTTRRFGGTGLGLRISRSLAEALGGHLVCESEDGRGSTFTIEIEADRVPGTAWLNPEQVAAELGTNTRDAASADTIADASGHGRNPIASCAGGGPPLDGLRILLAEDGPDNQRLIGFHLRRAGADLTIADNGRMAVNEFTAARAAGSPFDLILMDVQMPELDGYEATRLLRADGHRIPILALTAHAMAGDRERSQIAGCDDHLTKPIDPAGLITAIRRWTGRDDAPGSVTPAAAA